MAKRKYKKRKSAKRSWQGLYESYKEQYVKESIKHDMYDPIYNVASFMVTYEAIKNDMIAAGERPNNIIRTMVSRQSFKLSATQAKGILKAFEEEYGEKALKSLKEDDGINMRKIREGGKDVMPPTFWKAISDEYYKFLDEGYTGKEAGMRVSQSVFGSE